MSSKKVSIQKFLLLFVWLSFVLGTISQITVGRNLSIFCFLAALTYFTSRLPILRGGFGNNYSWLSIIGMNLIPSVAFLIALTQVKENNLGAGRSDIVDVAVVHAFENDFKFGFSNICFIVAVFSILVSLLVTALRAISLLTTRKQPGVVSENVWLEFALPACCGTMATICFFLTIFPISGMTNWGTRTMLLLALAISGTYIRLMSLYCASKLAKVDEVA